MSPPLLEVRELGFAYGARIVLDAVGFGMDEGELVGLVGPNAAGKSTLLELVAGLRKPCRGSVRVQGARTTDLGRRELARRVAFVPQSTPIDFELTGRDLVALGRLPWLGRFARPGPADERAIDEALEELDASALAERRVTELSGGERQRLVVARALAQGGALLVLDEPTAGLDPAHAHALLDAVERRVRRGGAAALVSLHDLALAAQRCDRILVLHRGRLLSDASPIQSLSRERLRDVFGLDAELVELRDGLALLVRRAVGGPTRPRLPDPDAVR
ncbi:MAG: ABC transporter ATP-binding protein [Myxococcota bacterium]|nr:ABC transporter ATP-binding protein [Myxococcota bacterium]MDW8360933.1 ABC transporter ATP-binding protein [Myxococcales bacterium]